VFWAINSKDTDRRATMRKILQPLHHELSDIYSSGVSPPEQATLAHAIHLVGKALEDPGL